MLSPEIWLAIGVVFVILEVIAPGLGFLFAGLGAISLGGLVTFHFLEVTSLPEQIAYFFFFTIIWGVVLWKPLKKAIKHKKGGYKNLSDASGVVDDERDLTPGKVGHVKWSGARMRARIRPNSSTERIKNGEVVYVHDQQDGVLLVDTDRPEQN
jgi:membrane protein implicated in regulation of membrane protease activity